MVAEQTLGVGQFPRGGDLGPPENERLLVEDTCVHEDQHEDRRKAVGLGSHVQGLRLQRGG